MNIGQALKLSGGLDQLDCELLLAHVLGKSRTWVTAHHDQELSADDEMKFIGFLARRMKGEPVAYIAGEKEFYGRMFFVTPATLIPRPSTELLVEQALKIVSGEEVDEVKEIDTDIIAKTELWNDIKKVTHVVDVGTGSGCIAITLACENPELHVIATDISTDALEVAKKNAERNGVTGKIDFRKGSGLEPVMDLDEPFFIVSNPPYIPAGIALQKDVQDFEPHSALFAGERGLDVITPLMEAARNHPKCVGIILEMRHDQVI